jgi:hypothetical protein
MPIDARIGAMTAPQASAGIVLLVGGDLKALARVGDAARRVQAEVQRVAPGDLAAEITSKAPPLIVIDLDDVGSEVLAEIPKGSGSSTVVAYFSHVDTDLGERARRAGFEALPRGRFWRELHSLVASAFGRAEG